MFSDVVGHKDLKKQLITNTLQGRISHTQLFLGAEGSGTLPLALAFARFVQCRDKKETDACGFCPSCLKINKMEHPDLHFFFPNAPNNEHSKNVSSKLFLRQWRELILQQPYFSFLDWLKKMGIENKQAIINAEDCNDIIRILGLKSYESPYKIIVVYMAEKFYYQAAPKLLKVLEEPPEKTLFLLIAENKDQILKTILSRAQILKVPLPGEESVKAELISKQQLDPKRAGTISFLSEGNMHEALRLLKQDEGQMADFHSFREWMRFCFKNQTAGILKWVEQTSRAGRERQKSFLQYGLKLFRLCVLQNYHAHELIRLEGEEATFIKNFSPYVNHKNATEVVDAFHLAINHLERNANPKILFTDLSFQLVRLMRVGAG